MSEQSPVQVLTDTECWEFLRSQQFGRLAFHLAGEVHIAPINYIIDSDRVIFRTAEGSKLLGLTMNADVAFETDQIDGGVATSVVIRGRAHQLEGDAADAADALPLHPWVDTVKLNVVAVTIDEIDGRRFRLTRDEE